MWEMKGAAAAFQTRDSSETDFQRQNPEFAVQSPDSRAKNPVDTRDSAKIA